MNGIRVDGGKGPEAIEVGLWLANQESNTKKITQIVLIGDAPPQTKTETIQNKTNYPNSWNGKPFAEVDDYLVQLEEIFLKNIPIHCFYLNDYAKNSFEEIAQKTGGQVDSLDVVNNPVEGAKLLCDVVTKLILKGVDPSNYQALELLYDRKYKVTIVK